MTIVDIFRFKLMLILSSFIAISLSDLKAETLNPDLFAWVGGFDVNKVEIVNAPKNLLIAGEETSEGDWIHKKSLPDFDFKSCHVFSYMHCLNGRDFAYALKINRFDRIPSNDEILGLAGANSMLIFESGSTYFIARNSSLKILIQNQEKVSSRTDVRKLLIKLFGSLGYDAIVLDVRGRFVLVGGIESDRVEGIKTISIYKKSEKSFLLKDDLSAQEKFEFPIVESKLGYAIGKLPDDFSEANLMPGQKVRYTK